MSLRVRFAAVLAVLAIVAAACGGGDDAAAPTEDLPAAPIAGACLAGDPECNDNPGQDADEPALEPGDPNGPSDVVTDFPIVGGGLSIADALAGDADGQLAIVGFLVQDGAGARLCDLLAESMPPQCGGASVELTDISTIDPDELKTEQGVTWTDFPVTVVGELANGVLTVTPLSN